MKIRTCWITRHGELELMPELVHAWDEYTIDGAETEYADSLRVAMDEIGGDLHEWRMITIKVDDALITRAFAPTELWATGE